MLSGGDYDVAGLRNCGSALAAGAVRAGLGTSLCRCRTRSDCALWRTELLAHFQTRRGRTPEIPLDFPDIKTLDKYNRPKVSTDDQLLNLRGLRHGWNVPLDELKLLELTSSRSNIWGKLYMNWVGPVLLTKFLVARDATLPQEHVHQIKVTKQRAKDSTQPISPPLLKSLAFSPFALTTLVRTEFEGDRAGYWTGKMEDSFEPDHVVKADIPMYLLQKVLPPSILDPPVVPKNTPRKRKRQTEDDARDDTMSGLELERVPTPVSKRKSTQKRSAGLPNPRYPTSNGSDLTKGAHDQFQDFTGRTRSNLEYVSLLSDSEEDSLPMQVRSSALYPGKLPPDSKDDDSGDDEDLVLEMRLGLQQIYKPRASNLSYQEDWSIGTADLVGQGSEAARRSSSQQPFRRTESSNSITTSESQPDLSRIFVSHGGKDEHTRPPRAVVMPPLGSAIELQGSNAAEIRAARLRFFGSENSSRTPDQYPLAPETPGRTVSRLIPLDIETIDLT